MKCTNCGNDVTKGALFCEYCGAKIVYQPQQQNIQQQSQPVAGQTGNNNKGLLIAIIAALSVMLVGVIIAAVVLLNKKPEERAEYTTEATTEETTEASTEATTEATTEEVVLVPYYEENNMIYSDCQETLHNGVYTFLVGSDDFFDRVESDQLEVTEHETDIKVTYATSTDAEEEGYEITKIYFNFDIPIEVTDHGYPDKYYYTYCSPEASSEIIKYLQTRPGLRFKDPLFDIPPSTLLTRFQEINDNMGWGFKGKYRFFRAHALRKFHASNIGLSAEYIDELQGRSKNMIHETYIKTNPEKLKSIYKSAMKNVMISEENIPDIQHQEFSITINIFLSGKEYNIF